jgi:hypothetical protein
MLIVGEEERKRNHFYPSPRTGRKGISVTIEEFADSGRRDQKTLKHLQFNLNYKVIAIRSNRGYQPQEKKDAHRINKFVVYKRYVL